MRGYTRILCLTAALTAVLFCLTGAAIFAAEVENTCVACHTKQATLHALIYFKHHKPGKEKEAEAAIKERIEEIRIDMESQIEDHTMLPCEQCHQGNPARGPMKEAHQGVVTDVSDKSKELCGDCHDGEMMGFHMR